MAEQRYYVVVQADGKERLVEAANPAQALRFAAKTLITNVSSASAREVAALMTAGVEIEQASAE